MGLLKGLPILDEITRYGLSEDDVVRFFELIDINLDDIEVIFGFEKDNPHTFVKFAKKFSTHDVTIIMKVAIYQLKERIRRQYEHEWEEYNKVRE